MTSSLLSHVLVIHTPRVRDIEKKDELYLIQFLVANCPSTTLQTSCYLSVHLAINLRYFCAFCVLL